MSRLTQFIRGNKVNPKNHYRETFLAYIWLALKKDSGNSLLV